jgi:hypothetical protein
MAWQFYTKDGELKTTGSGGACQIDGLAEISAAAQGDIIIRDGTDWDNVNIGTNEVVARAAGDVAGIAIPAQSLLARQAGSLASLTVAEDELLGRLAGGNLGGLTPSQVNGLLFSGAGVYNDANISIPDATYTAITFNSEVFDTDDYHSTASNTSRLTVPVAGYYLITCSLNWASPGTNCTFRTQFVVNGTTTIAGDGFKDDVAVNLMRAAVVQLAASDYVEIEVRQNTGSSLNLNAASGYAPYAYIVRVG